MTSARPDEISADAYAPPTDQEIREQLAKIRSSPAFDAPERAQRFLAYVIEETLQCRADRIKAYSIAIEVFGRDASFDAQNDPVVRIEAGRVRRALEHYYLLAGQRDPILITIPKGGYVPAFTRFNELTIRTAREATEPAVALPRSRSQTVLLAGAALLVVGLAGWGLIDRSSLQKLSGTGQSVADNTVPAMPKVMVAAFEDITGTPTSALLTRGLNDEVIGQMARFKEIRVVSDDTATGSVAALSVSDLPFYRLEGRIRLDDDRLRFSARLVDRVDGAIVWTKTYDAKMSQRELMDVETEISGEVATALAQPYGVIFQSNASEVLDAPSQDAAAYACGLSYYGYRADLNRQSHAAVQTCLKEVVSRFPNHATGWALLSLTYLDELRFRYRLKPEGPPPLDMAVQAAQRAVELDPGNVRALQAEMLGYFFKGDVRNALAVGGRAFALNPNDTEFTGEYGFRLALSGDWARGCGLISRAVDRNPGPVDYFRAAMAVCNYMDGDYEEAERLARAVDLQDNPIHHLILTAIYGQRGKHLEAQLERNWLELNAPEYVAGARDEVARRILRTEDQEHFIDGLRKAGIDVSVQRTLRSQQQEAPIALSRG
jgi:TolB-like protein